LLKWLNRRGYLFNSRSTVTEQLPDVI
jgi:hypothetical protein